MIFESMQQVVDKVRAELAITAPGVIVTLGKHNLKQRANPTLGRVVFLPAATATIGLPTRQDQGARGEKARILCTNKQVFEIHCWAKAPDNAAVGLDAEERRERQYGDDLTQAERVRTKVVGALFKYCEGPQVGGAAPPTEAGENVFGVELVFMAVVEIQGRDLPLLLAPPDSVFGAGGDCDCKDVPIKVPDA